MQCNYKMVKLPEQAEDSTGRQIIFGHEPNASKKWSHDSATAPQSLFVRISWVYCEMRFTATLFIWVRNSLK